MIGGKKYRLSAIPDAPRDASPELRRMLLALKEATEVRNGVRGDPLEEVVTKKDLVDGGLAEFKKTGGSGRGGGIFRVTPGGPGSTLPQVQRPTTPILEGSGVLGGIHLSWNIPVHAYEGHLRTEVWIVSSADPDTTRLSDRANAVLVNETTGFGYTHTSQDIHFTAWVRFVNRLGQPGPYSEPVSMERIPDAAQLADEMEEELEKKPVIKGMSSAISGMSSTIGNHDTAIGNHDTAIGGMETALGKNNEGEYEWLKDTGERIAREENTARFIINNKDDGIVTGFALTADDENGSSFVIRADTFAVVGDGVGDTVQFPFTVTNGKVFIKDAVINKALIESVTAEQLTVGNANKNITSLFYSDVNFAGKVRLTNEVLISNANITGALYADDSRNNRKWSLNQNGTFRMGSTGTNGMVMTENGISIYTNGVEVVRLGKL